ncbi:MAG TPA: hypothetical protein VMM60_02375, partial [Ilumatobacter sp.]|nr:hypothetical protein [Ilumatobacter sp.]
MAGNTVGASWQSLLGLEDGRLEDWLDEQSVGSGPIEEPTLLAGGTQNILIRFRRGDISYVLRRPPQAKRPNSDDTMRREIMVLAALASSDVPHPSLI